MKPYRYHILLSLARGTLHGAEIRRRVDEESDGTVTLYPAQLYGALDDLAREGWIREVEPEEVPKDQVRWRFYALAPEGRRALEDETRRLEGVLGRARETLGTVDGG
jgi:DNA-binding PadR family transcriptional regulator